MLLELVLTSVHITRLTQLFGGVRGEHHQQRYSYFFNQVCFLCNQEINAYPDLQNRQQQQDRPSQATLLYICILILFICYYNIHTMPLIAKIGIKVCHKIKYRPSLLTIRLRAINGKRQTSEIAKRVRLTLEPCILTPHRVE